ncbi:unnamed protein product [Schistosoma margrebowiei]|uniref:Uncharacterized protein n=1 Tax=Schistosoma margrebowiei TaxID=48269 RepID=A0A183NAU8_9TREM|nr:unnamed protein product [Schistosoma margrebowiei]
MNISTFGGKYGIHCTSRMQLDNPDFADDPAPLSHTQEQKQGKTNSVEAVSEAVGVNIHRGKSKILRYNTTCTNPITINGEVLGDVKTFTYLSSIIDEHGGSDADMKGRIGKARAAYVQMTNIWNAKQLSANTKVRIFNTSVQTVQLYGAGTTKNMQVFINRFLYKIHLIRWPDIIAYNILLERTNEIPA